MVQTRSSRAPEPLEVLATPPKRTRKTRSATRSQIKPKIIAQVPSTPHSQTLLRNQTSSLTSAPTQENQNPAPALHIAPSILSQAPRLNYENTSIQIGETDFLSETVDTAHSVQTSSKRRHVESDTDHDEPATKRREKETAQPSKDHIFMFSQPDEDDDATSMSAPPKTFAASLRRNRYKRSITKQSNRLGVTPRRPLLKLDGEDPFGFKTFEASQSSPRPALQATETSDSEVSSWRRSSSKKLNSTTDLMLRDDRSPAPEPETPRRGLFGSLRNIGSATLGLAKSAVTHFTPRRDTTALPTQETTPDRQSPSSRPQTSDDVRYPALEPVNEKADGNAGDWSYRRRTPEDGVDADDENLDDESRKRKEFIARYGRPDSRYDHLHTTPMDGNPEQLAYPLPKTQESTEPLTEAQLRSRKRRLRLLGQDPDEELPATAPLFGPNSHYARGTMNPIYAKLASGEPHPLFSASTKRKYEDTGLGQKTSDESGRKSKAFQPYMEDEDENIEEDVETEEEDATSTPLLKKQKTTATDTPRSAMKVPNSVGRSTGKSVAFNANPVTGIRQISAVYGGYGRAGHYSGGIFSTPTDNKSPTGSLSDTSTLEISPTTQANTFVNSGLHPGDKLTRSINDAMPNSKDKVLFQWNNPNDPTWRPTLGNPSPGTFRVPYDLDDDEMEDLDERLGDDNESENTPEQPSTPRPSHAELPKNTSAHNDRAVDDTEREKTQIEKARLAAEKHKPRSQSRLSNVTAARSRSPSPPKDSLAPDTAVDDIGSRDSSVETPEEIFDPPTWTQNPETGEYICSNSRFPDFIPNEHNELVPSLCLLGKDNEYDDVIRGPDGMTEKERQEFYAKKYGGAFKFDAPQTYEEAGAGTKVIHDLIRTFEKGNPEAVKRAQENMKREWDAHERAIEDAHASGLILKPVYPDRIGEGMMVDDDEDEL